MAVRAEVPRAPMLVSIRRPVPRYLEERVVLMVTLAVHPVAVAGPQPVVVEAKYESG